MAVQDVEAYTNLKGRWAMDVGAELRHAREQRGLSLEQLAHRTKIPHGALDAIEKNDIGRLPGGIFTRGFLKSYAREVGLDPADIAQRYVAQFEPEAPPGATSEPTPPERGLPKFTAPTVERAADTTPPWVHQLRRIPAGRLLSALALVVVAYLVLARPPESNPPEPAVTPTAQETGQPAPGPSTAQPREAATAGTSAETPSSAVGRSQNLRIDLLPRAAVWISATADGNRVIYRVMQPGDRQSIEVRNELVLRIGEPANFDYAINGVSGRSIGRPGEPVTARINLRNYEQFIAR